MEKKRKKIIIIIASIVALVAIVIGAVFIVRAIFFRPIKNEHPFDGNGSTHTVNFDSMGGSQVESVTVTDGNPVRRPATPERDGYFLVGWYRESTAETEWIFDSDRVKEDLTLYALWQEIAPPHVESEPTASLVYVIENGEYTVTDVGEETVVVIPSTYEGLPVTKIQGLNGTGAFARKAIIEVTVPDSIIEIGQNTFNNCSELQTVNIGEKSALTTIGRNAFSGNSALTSIYIPASVTEIGDSAFNNDGEINFIVAQENAVYRSENGHLIERATHTLIRGGQSGEIPDSVTAIAQAAFRRGAINTINIPASVETIGNYAFNDCANLTAINVAAENANFAAMDGILYNKAMDEIECVPASIAGDIVLSDFLTELPNSAFDGRAALTSVYIPNTLTRIRLNSFRNTSLTIRYGGTEAQWGEIDINRNWGGAELVIIYNYNS